MKLHLPCALRGALLAVLALTCTVPAWAYESNPEYNGKYIYLFEDADAINTALSTPENNTIYIRPADNLTDPVEPGQNATIGTATLGAGHTLVVETNEWQSKPSFTNLTFNTVAVADGGSATINVTENNTLTIGSVAAGSDLTLNVNGTLYLSFADFAGTGTRGTDGVLSYTGGLADSLTGNGTLVLTGTIDWDSDADGHLWSPNLYSPALNFNFGGKIDISQLNVTAGNGLVASLSHVGNIIGVTLYDAPLGHYTESSTAPAVATYSNKGSNFASTKVGSLSVGTNATKTWTMTLTGTVTNPNSGSDLVLISTQSVSSASAQNDYGTGNFCLYLTADGSLVLHRGGELTGSEHFENSNADYSSTTLMSGLGSNWQTCEYAITLSYAKQGTFFLLTADKTSSSLVLDGTTHTISYTYSSIDLGAAPNVDALENLSTRLPGQSDLNISVTGDAVGGSYWMLSSDVSVAELQSGTLPSYSATGTSTAALSSQDALRFAGGTLSSGSAGTPVVTLNNAIEVVDGYQVRLAPAAGTKLVLTKASGALSGNKGLVIEGGSSSTVELQGVTNAAPENISLSAETALAISGPSTLTLDASLNSFDPSSSLSKNDGGSLLYIAAGQDTLAVLSNEQGSLEIQGELTTSQLTAHSLKLVASGARATTDTLTATSRVDLSADTHLSANNMKTNGLLLIGGSSLDVGSGRLEVTGENSADVGGTLTSRNITMTGHNGYANLKGFVLTGDSLAADKLTNAHITIGSPVTRAASGTTVLELANASGSLIQVNTDTIIRNSLLIGSTVKHNGGSLTLQNSMFDATNTITSTVAGGGIILDSATFLPGSALTADGTTYTITTASPAMTLTGTATGAEMALTQLIIDATGDTTEQSNTIFLDSGSGSVNLDNCAITLYTAPGMLGSLHTDAHGNLVYSVREDIAGILNETADTTNSRAAVPALTAGAANGGELAELYTYVLSTSRASLAERRAVLHQLTSGSITMLADSQRRGVVNTVNNIRNRVVQMGNPQGIEFDKNVHAWITADGSYNDIDQDGGSAGYEYQAWGGTVGVHADVGNFSFGAAVSASYGELTAHSNDRAEGDHDSVSLNAFARHQSGRWMQMGILSLSRNELEMERYVHDYTAEGDTSGHTITAYYEAGYTFSLTEDSSQVLQPIASIMLTSARMDGFSETGSIGNAALCTETEDYIYGTVGIGARYQLVLAEDMNERLAFLEVRAKLVQDFGDETDETTVHFDGAPGTPFSVRGADVGRTGFQFGVGISVPTGIYTTFFADVDADIRSGATSVSGNVGMRVEF